MAGYREIGIGLASALASHRGPDPFPVTFQGQNLEEAARIVVAVADECREAGITLENIELDPELYQAVRALAPSLTVVTSNPNLHCEVRFFRHAN